MPSLSSTFIVKQMGFAPNTKTAFIESGTFFFFFFYQHSFLDPTKCIVPSDCIVSQHSELFVFLKITFDDHEGWKWDFGRG